MKPSHRVKSDRLHPSSLGGRIAGALTTFAFLWTLWLLPASVLLPLFARDDFAVLVIAGVPAFLAAGWLCWHPRVTRGGDASTAAGPDFKGCLEYERVMGQKRIALLSYLQVTLLFVSLYIFKVAPLASLVMAGFLLWTLFRTFQPEDPGAAPRIIPVFRPHAPKGSQTFLRGFALARNFDRLEQLASEGKVPPLSTYGFACALHGEEMSWHAAGQAAPTVEHLLRTVQRKGEDEAELAQDLEALLGALSSADDQTEMALLLRCSNFTSGLEWERIGGSPC